jgi:hypothetical protein
VGLEDFAPYFEHYGYHTVGMLKVRGKPYLLSFVKS